MEKVKTEVIKLEKMGFRQTLTKAAQFIKRGELVVFPTETVYGLGARVDRVNALKKIFKAKGRPADNPLIVHVAQVSQLKKLIESISPLEKKIIKKFWPGPLTIVFPKKKKISNIVSGGLSTIAVRMPAHKFAQALIKKSGIPIAAPSANISGRPSGTMVEHIFADLKGKVPIMVDAGRSKIGLESTVIKVEKEKILILRPGAVTSEMLQEVAKIPVRYSRGKTLRASPGTRYRHYAPRARLEILPNAAALRHRLAMLKKKNKKVGILQQRSLRTASKNLYRDLRALDTRGVDVILAVAYREQGLGTALMDRLRRGSVR